MAAYCLRCKCMHKLSNLLSDISYQANFEIGTKTITAIACDSRKVVAGSLFMAIDGELTDGHQFIPQALALGAEIIVGTRLVSEVEEIYPGINYIQVSPTSRREVWAQLCLNYWNIDQDDLPFPLVAVTGTDGKTTTLYLLFQLLQKAGVRVSLLSTVGIFINGEKFTKLDQPTTPDIYDVCSFLDTCRQANSQVVLLEVTSYAHLHRRTWGLKFAVAGITNLAMDHLSLHKTLDNYAQAKAEILSNARKVLVNTSTIGHHQSKFTYLPGFTAWNTQILEAVSADQLHLFKAKHLGEYNLQNLALALSLLKEVDNDWYEKSLQYIGQVQLPEGRQAQIPNDKGLRIYVDYAHTPQGLETILTTMRAQLKQGENLHCLFGCEGFSTPQKRAPMGAVAARLADFVYLIPISVGKDSLEKINAEILSGFEEIVRHEEVPIASYHSRYLGIKAALLTAQPGDIVLVLGSGHERYVENGLETTDAEQIMKQLEAL